jgi:translation elongation factor EF-G
VRTPNIDSPPESAQSGNWIFAGHISSAPERLAEYFRSGFEGLISSFEIPDDEIDYTQVLTDIDAAALVVSAKTGVSQKMIEFWNYLNERQIPRMVLVNGLELSETDFDDIVMIANRVFEEVITPFLVLHDDVGEPIGLISLADLLIHDYSNQFPDFYNADEELTSLVSEFRAEYETQSQLLNEHGFETGLAVPALPVIENRKIGINEVAPFLNKIRKNLF